MSDFPVSGPILVTGASSGIGRAIALALNQAGATVIANGRDEKRLGDTKGQAARPDAMRIAPRDLAADLESLPKWLGEIAKEHGPLTGLATSAGITWNAPLAFYNKKKTEEIFAICCHAPMILAGAFCKKRINAGPCSAIVHIAAGAAIDPNPGQGVYAAAKAGLIAASRCLAKEAAPAGIRVNCISPGLVDTPMMAATCAQLGESFLEREKQRYPLGLGLPEDVANLAVFLLSAQARWITGQNFVINGGC